MMGAVLNFILGIGVLFVLVVIAARIQGVNEILEDIKEGIAAATRL